MSSIIVIILLISTLISIIWVRGISYMDEHYPDYRGEDLFNEIENQSYDQNRDTKTAK